MLRPRHLFVFLLVALFAVSAFAQGTSSTLSGTATSDGAPLPGVTVTVSSPALQGTRTAVTGDGGGYTFPSLPPGAYTVTFELAGMSKVTKNVQLTLASTSRADADLKMGGITEAITVTASAPAVLETTDVARNFSQEEIAQLPVRRNIIDTVVLAPGVNQNGARSNISISGAASFDNLFLVNGVTVNENLRGQPHNLFIEDAIQETTILTGSVSAEYGRFTGGVVSTITKSGGNEFHGSLRDSMTNADWIELTPIETVDHPDKVASVYEGTLGGFVMKDRIWFFAAGRDAKGAPAVGINPTGSTVAPTGVTPITFQNTLAEKRYEAKLTAQVLPQHSVVVSYLDIDNVETNNYFAPIYDEASIVRERSLPNSLKSASYSGVLTSNLLLEAQYSEKEFAFVGSGGQFTDQIRGTWIADSTARWNAPVFCGVCTNERRDNDSLLGKATYFVNTKGLGTHSFVFGGEKFHETRLVNNFQSASQYQITSTGTATFFNGNPYPRFDSSSTITYRPILELSNGSDLTTNAIFLNDKWDLSSHFNFNVGVRYDKNDAVDASGNVVSDDSAFSPRLGMIYDVQGNGRYRFNASYSHYVTKIVDGNVGGGAAGAGNPAAFNYRYDGPVVNPAGTANAALVPTQAALKILFDWFNGLTDAQKAAVLTSSSIPGYSTQVDDPISSPYVRELVVGFGTQFSSRGYARVDLISRDWHDFYATRLDIGTGKITAPNGAVGDRAILVNDDDNIERTYRGAQLQFQWNPNRFNFGGGYTWSQLKGNDVPEGDGTAGVTNAFGLFYPEYLNYENRQPSGFLNGDQTHRIKAWAGYDVPFPFGNLNASVIQSYDSGRAYSAVGTIDASGTNTPFTGSPVNPGYTRSQLGTSHNYYFSKRGEFRTDAATATDLALNYTLPIRKFELFAQGQVLNIFNEDAVNDIYLSRMDFTVRTRRANGAASGLVAFNPYTDVPKECPQNATAAECTALGANFQLGPNFGKAISKDAYQQPRTYRFAVGIRF